MIICTLHPSMRKEGNRHVSVLGMGEDRHMIPYEDCLNGFYSKVPNLKYSRLQTFARVSLLSVEIKYENSEGNF